MERDYFRSADSVTFSVCGGSLGRYRNYFFFATCFYRFPVRFLSLLRRCTTRTGIFCKGGWSPMVCKSQMTWGLLLLAASHLSATSESRELLQNTYNIRIQRQGPVCGEQPAHNVPDIPGFTELWSGQLVLCFSFLGPPDFSEDSGNVKSLLS